MFYVTSLDDLMIPSCMGWRWYFVVDIDVCLVKWVRIGRDGLTHNMLELIHSHWRLQKVCKVRCKGVPTVDMDNICRHLEVLVSPLFLYSSISLI